MQINTMFSKGHIDPIHFSTFLLFIIRELGFWVWGWERCKRTSERVCVSHYVTTSGSARSHWECGIRLRSVASAPPSFSPFCLFPPLLSSLSSRLPWLLLYSGRHWVCHIFMIKSKTHHNGLMHYGKGRWTGARSNNLFWRLLITQWVDVRALLCNC